MRKRKQAAQNAASVSKSTGKIVTRRRTTVKGQPRVLFTEVINNRAVHVFVDPKHEKSAADHFQKYLGMTVVNARPGRPPAL